MYETESDRVAFPLGHVENNRCFIRYLVLSDFLYSKYYNYIWNNKNNPDRFPAYPRPSLIALVKITLWTITLIALL